MKKIHVLNSVSVMNRAGQETLLMNVLRNIDRNEIQYDFLCSSTIKGDYDDEIEKLGSNIFHLSKNCLKKFFILRDLYMLYTIYLFFCKHRDIDIFHIHNYHAFSAFLYILGAKMAGVHVVILHSHNSSAPHPKLHCFFRKVIKNFRIHKFACSRAAAQWMYGDDCDDVVIVKNGIILKDFTYREEWRALRREFGVDESTLLVGHIGRFNVQKNHTFLIDVFSEILKTRKDAKLLLIGRGELELEVKEKVHSLGLDDNVVFAGVRSDVNKLLSCIDVFLFPSLFEGLPVVLIEVQAASLPCVASDTISREAGITSYVNFLSLQLPVSTWADNVLQFSSINRKSTHQVIQKEGFDICETTQRLCDFYCHLL